MDYRLDIDFKMYDIDNNYYRNGQKCIFDPIREMLIVETPEEIIRQKFVKYLIHELDVPISKIDVEVPMTHFKKGARGRADIVVFGENEDGVNYPIILIECKAPNISLIDDVWSQVFKYDEILGTGYTIITNGDFTCSAVWDEENEEYRYIEELLGYNEFLSDGEFKFIIDDLEDWRRPLFSELISKETVRQFMDYGWIGEDTPEYLYPLTINLAGFLQDESLKFSPVNSEGINIIEDGHRYTSFGNAAGGSWEGDYRYFILKDENGNNQIISMLIIGSLKCTNHPKFGNRKGHTTLVVAIDDFDKKHNSLQLNIDKYTKIDGKKYTIWHDGTLTVGKNGAAKKNEVVDFIKKRDPSMVDLQGNIILGKFDCSKEINFEQQNTKCFIINIIKYALFRDEYRKMKLN